MICMKELSEMIFFVIFDLTLLTGKKYIVGKI